MGKWVKLGPNKRIHIIYASSGSECPVRDELVIDVGDFIGPFPGRALDPANKRTVGPPYQIKLQAVVGSEETEVLVSTCYDDRSIEDFTGPVTLIVDGAEHEIELVKGQGTLVLGFDDPDEEETPIIVSLALSVEFTPIGDQKNGIQVFVR